MIFVEHMRHLLKQFVQRNSRLVVALLSDLVQSL